MSNTFFPGGEKFLGGFTPLRPLVKGLVWNELFQFILQIIFGYIINIYHWHSDFMLHHHRFRVFYYCSRNFWSWICESRALQAKDRTWANCALALSVSGASRSRLCPDGPRVHLSGLAYIPSCIRPEVRLPRGQRVLCGDCWNQKSKKGIGY